MCCYILKEMLEKSLNKLTFAADSLNYVSSSTDFQITGCCSSEKNPLFSPFPIEKPKLLNLTLS